ncbi:hypothetical protein ACFFGR_20005 [Arthrobacter liuii]|nr:hypothetical protein [Arthrobacter liuii]
MVSFPGYWAGPARTATGACSVERTARLAGELKAQLAHAWAAGGYQEFP